MVGIGLDRSLFYGRRPASARRIGLPASISGRFQARLILIIVAAGLRALARHSRAFFSLVRATDGVNEMP
jgi:hypothetical protein